MRTRIQTTAQAVLVAITLGVGVHTTAFAAPASGDQVQVDTSAIGDGAALLEQDLLKASQRVAKARNSTVPIYVKVVWLDQAEFTYGIRVWLGEFDGERSPDASAACPQCVLGDISPKAADLIEQALRQQHKRAVSTPKPVVQAPATSAPPPPSTPPPRPTKKKLVYTPEVKGGIGFLAIGGAMALSGTVMAVLAKDRIWLKVGGPIALTSLAPISAGGAVLGHGIQEQRATDGRKPNLGFLGALGAGQLVGGAALGATSVGLLAASNFQLNGNNVSSLGLSAGIAGSAMVLAGTIWMLTEVIFERRERRKGVVDHASFAPWLSPTTGGASANLRF